MQTHRSTPRSPVLLIAALMLVGCGAEVIRRPQQPPPTLAAPATMVEIWSANGGVSTVGGAGIGAQTVFIIAAARDEQRQRMVAIDRTSRRVLSRVIAVDQEILRIDPLIVERWDGQRPRWLGTRLMGLTDELEPIWESDPMNIMPPRYAGGPLVIVEQAQSGEYAGFDPVDGRVVFRLRSEPDGAMNEAVEADSFIVVPAEDRAALVDRETGEINAIVDAPLGSWEVVGDRLVVASESGLVAYDAQGREVWSRSADLGRWARTILSWSPDQPPAHSDVFVVWQRGRGLVAIDESGVERWVDLRTDEASWGELILRGDRLLVMSERERLLDVRSGEVLFTCPQRCRIRRHDAGGVLVEEAGPDGHPSLALYGYDGQRRWRHAPELFDERGERDAPSGALLEELVATCASGSLTFLRRTDGTVLSTHMLPSAPENQRSGSPYCDLSATGDLVLAATERGAALFGPSREGEETVAARVLPPLGPGEEPAVRGFYELSTLVPPPNEEPAEEYLRGRTAYRRARDAFRAGRFSEAADLFIEAYRAFFAADRGEIQRLGLESCYGARVSVDHAGGDAYDALLARIDESEERCRRIFINAPPPSRPF